MQIIWKSRLAVFLCINSKYYYKCQNSRECACTNNYLKNPSVSSLINEAQSLTELLTIQSLDIFRSPSTISGLYPNLPLKTLSVLLSLCMNRSNLTPKNKHPHTSRHRRGKWEKADSLLSQVHTYTCHTANWQAEIIFDTSTEAQVRLSLLC